MGNKRIMLEETQDKVLAKLEELHLMRYEEEVFDMLYHLNRKVKHFVPSDIFVNREPDGVGFLFKNLENNRELDLDLAQDDDEIQWSYLKTTDVKLLVGPISDEELNDICQDGIVESHKDFEELGIWLFTKE